ncbi:MAG TPA: carbohydrate ABC transporter permease [Thermodesulfobacteriota bacterium]
MTRAPRKTAIRADDVATYVILAATVVFCLVPILWALVTSLKVESDVVAYPPRWWPDPVTLESYRLVFQSNMPRYYLNSLVVALLTLAVTLAAGSLGGYAAARFDFRGKKLVLFLLLMTIMIPGIVVLVPLYLMANQVGLQDTYLGLVLVYAGWQVPTAIWLMRGFFESIPRDLEEAALIDGCTPFQAFVRVILPLTRPGLAAASMVVFIWVWNEFIIALTLTSSDQMRLVPVGLYLYVSSFGVEWGPLMAAVCVALLPVIGLFVVLQRQFVEGLTSGGTKG